ncbi:MAG: serine/threonine protein kinase [Kaiparowitsia implicata GSE-PSE-MK54-09C]|jgi:serine/threonine-protein kinase|nr:serine/threonine protein kinase [Kaiparowitsia implicata GSE-PSE-MK54-09C]
MQLSLETTPQPPASSPTDRLHQYCGDDTLFRDRYRVIKALGRGGFGVTFLARDAALPGSPVCVIKQLCPKVSNPSTLARACERFEREAKTLSQLGSHAHIPQLLDYFQVDDQFYLVQEYVRGWTLAKEIRQQGPLSEYGVKRFLLELLPVLTFVHQQQVIHRDIKPPNIIRCQDDGRLVLIDFGAVKERIVELEDTAHRGATTQFVGTIGFAPPEQLALRPSYASDIYAIGVTCLFLLTGKPPMEFDYDPVTGELRWEDEVNVSEHFGNILRRMLRISVRDRYQSADQLLRVLELEPYLDNLSECLNRPRRLNLTEEATARPSLVADHGLGRSPFPPSPFSKTAEQIRGWRKRLQQRQQQPWITSDLASSNY